MNPLVIVTVATPTGEVLDRFAVAHWKNEDAIASIDDFENVGSPASRSLLAYRIERSVAPAPEAPVLASGPNPSQLAALREFARMQGRTWKANLRHAWETGNYEGYGVSGADVCVLQQVRNQFGPSWLASRKGKWWQQ